MPYPDQSRQPVASRLATSIDNVRPDERWVHEIKFDGYWVQVHLRDAAVKVFTRRGNDWTEMDIEDLNAEIESGRSIEEAAQFLCRADSVDEVARKCEELGLKPRSDHEGL
jgi:ATP-dependent DNA ligase